MAETESVLQQCQKKFDYVRESYIQEKMETPVDEDILDFILEYSNENEKEEEDDWEFTENKENNNDSESKKKIIQRNKG